MAVEILMPALSPTMEEGKLAKWLVKEGDNITSGDIIAEIETDKATMEVEAVDEGTVGRLLVERGQHSTRQAVESEGRIRISDALQRTPNDIGEVHVTLRGDLSSDQREARGDERLTGDP